MRARLAAMIGVLLLALGGGIAMAASALDPAELERALEPSAHAALLGPVAPEGRKGWDCEPEHAAEGAGWSRAHLPTTDAP